MTNIPRKKRSEMVKEMNKRSNAGMDNLVFRTRRRDMDNYTRNRSTNVFKSAEFTDYNFMEEPDNNTRQSANSHRYQMKKEAKAYMDASKKKRKEDDAKMAGSIREKHKKVREQGYAAAREGTLYPRELQNVSGDRWEDAKVYNKNTRQGQNYWSDHMKSYPESYEKWMKGEEGRETREQIIENKKRLGVPTKGPMAKPIESPAEQRMRKMRNAIADRLLKKGNIRKRKEKW